MTIKDRVVEAITPELYAGVDGFWSSEYGQRCGSDIERAFAAAVFISGRIRYRDHVATSRAETGELTCFFMEQQVEIGPYRVDFLFGAMPEGKDLAHCVVVECDGHDFHDRTKEQAARDKARDRFLSTQVGKVIRFTGSEIYRDPARCAYEMVTVFMALARHSL